MKLTGKILLFGLLLLASCAVYKDPQLPQARLDENEKAFIAKFEDAVVKHKKALLNSYLFPVYRSEQLEGMYQNDAKAFWNQFFCGKQIDNPDKFTCLKLKNIREIYITKVTPTNDTTEKVITFKVVGYDQTIFVELILKKYYDKNGQLQYGIIGAYG